jgi:hypothetical protein
MRSGGRCAHALACSGVGSRHARMRPPRAWRHPGAPRCAQRSVRARVRRHGAVATAQRAPRRSQRLPHASGENIAHAPPTPNAAHPAAPLPRQAPRTPTWC